MANDLKIFSTFRVKVEELLRDSIEFLIDKFKMSRKMFSVSSVYGQILYVVENLFQLNLFYIEDSISEMNVQKASRNASKYSLASLAGHNPSRAMSASGEIVIRPKSNIEVEVPSSVIILPNYNRIVCDNNGKSYVIVLPSDDVRVPTNFANEVRATIYQGRLETQIFTGAGRKFESIAVPYPTNYFIDNFLVDVYVNDTKWTRFDNLVHMPRGEQGYVVRTGVNSGLEIYFGNGKLGAYPNPGDEIRVEYLVTDGFSGRLGERVKENVTFSFLDSGFTVLGEEVDVNDVLQVETSVIPDFGANPEDVNFTLRMLPKKNDALIRTENYEVLLNRLDYFSIIRVNQDTHDERMINMFLVPDITKTIDSNKDYFSIPVSDFRLSAEKKNHLLSLIARTGTTIIGTESRILDPVIRRYVLNVILVIYENYNPDIIKNDITLALGQYFMSVKRSDRIPRSDIISVIEQIDGVDSVNVRIIGERNEAAKAADPDAQLVGLDQFNDIVMGKDDLPVIRGGWQDRDGNLYSEGLSFDDNFGALNIRIEDIIKPIEKNF